MDEAKVYVRVYNFDERESEKKKTNQETERSPSKGKGKKIRVIMDRIGNRLVTKSGILITYYISNERGARTIK